MSANIGIKENDKTKNFTVKSLTIDLQNNGGLSEWVLESDLKLDTISIDRNGTYTPSSDYYGFSQVTVNVMQIVQGNEDDKPKIIAVDPNTGEIVETEVPTGFPTIGGDTPWIVGNDPDTGSPVIVAADDGGAVHETGVDPEFLPVIDNIIDKGLCDPYVPSTDDNGDEVVTTYYQNTDDLVKRFLPSSISIVSPPSKIKYNNGETINISGLVVVANMNSGGTWTNASYPNGHISLGELVIDPPVASAEGGGIAEFEGDGVSAISISAGGEWLPERWSNGVPSGGDAHRCSGIPIIALEPKGSSIMLTNYNGTLYGSTSANLVGILSTDSGTSRAGAWGSGGGSGLFGAMGSITMLGSYASSIPESTTDPTKVAPNSLSPVTVGQTIIVKWKRPVDGSELSASFTIQVVVSNTSGTTGGGYSDDSGGSSSGGGTHF